MASRKKQEIRLGEDARMVADLKIAIWEDSVIDNATREQLIAFLSYLIVDGLRPKTVAGYAVFVCKLARQCPGKGFLYLQRRDVRQIIFAEQEKGYRPSTMRLFKARFLRFQRWLREEYGYPADYPDHTAAGTKFQGRGRPAEFSGIRIAVKQGVAYGPEDLPARSDVGASGRSHRLPPGKEDCNECGSAYRGTGTWHDPGAEAQCKRSCHVAVEKGRLQVLPDIAAE